MENIEEYWSLNLSTEDLCSAATTYSKSYIFPSIGFYLGKFAVLPHIVGLVHFLDISFGGGSKHFDYLNKLIYLRIAHERRTSVDHLDQNAAS